MDRAFRDGQIRMEGKLDRIGDAVQRQTEDMRDLRSTVAGHGTRITTLETTNTLKDGERKGLALGGRIAWTLAGLIPGTALVAAFAKLLGL